MSTTKQLLRGHRGRKARRFLKRHPESYIIGHLPTPQGKLGVLLFGPPVISDEPQSIDVGAGGDWAGVPTPSTAEMQPMLSPDEAFESASGDTPVCETCGATGDNPCVTKSGKIASKEHASRRSL